MRPETPLAVENGVGKLAAYMAPNAGNGKESVALHIKRAEGRTKGTWSQTNP
jgi:hypothetical protein